MRKDNGGNGYWTKSCWACRINIYFLWFSFWVFRVWSGWLLCPGHHGTHRVLTCRIKRVRLQKIFVLRRNVKLGFIMLGVVLRPVHTTLQLYFSAGYRLPSTIIRHENGAFRKRSSNRTENTLKTKLFDNDGLTIIIWFSYSSLFQSQIQNDRWLLRFRIWTDKI